MIILLVIISIFLSYFQCSFAETTSQYVYKDLDYGIIAYKEINAFQVVLSNGYILTDSTVTTGGEIDINNGLKKLEIVFIIDTSGSMKDDGKSERTRDASKKLVESLFNKVNDQDKLSIGVIFFNYSMDTNNVLQLSNSKDEILKHLDKIYANGGTYMATSVTAAKQMLEATGNTNEDGVIKIICTLSDGLLGDEPATVQEFQNANTANISTMSIFVATPITAAFEQLANGNDKHKNFWTNSENLEDTIVNDIYGEIYMRVITMVDPSSEYSVNNVGVLPGDKVILQLDEEILHGATIKIEYVFSIITAFDCDNIIIEDVFDDTMYFDPEEKLLTEDKYNKDYGWKIENTRLVSDSGNNVQEAINEYRIKLILSTVLTPERLDDFGIIRNSMQFSLKDIKKNMVFLVEALVEEGKEGEPIRALDFSIIPPTGKSDETERNIAYGVSIIIIIASYIFMGICIFAYIEQVRKKRKMK